MTKELQPFPALIRILHLVRKYGMEAVFATLLGIARSKSHLRALHDKVLPPNCRLLRKDYLVLERAWEALHPNPLADTKISADEEEAIEYLFKTALASFKGYSKDSTNGQGNLTGYYYDKLRGEYEPLEGFSNGMPFQIFGTPFPNGGLFEGVLFGHRFPFAFILSIDGQRLAVRMFIISTQLTEPLTHALLTGLPPAESWHSEKCWIFPADSFMQHITDGEVLNVGQHCHVAKPGFVPAVMEALQAKGVPIESLVPCK